MGKCGSSYVFVCACVCVLTGGAADTSLSRPASLERPPNTHTTAVTHSPIRDSARYSSAQGSLREWFEAQSTHANMDMLTAAGRVNVHLLPRSASLKQAGGLQRMILRGHAGPIQKVCARVCLCRVHERVDTHEVYQPTYSLACMWLALEVH